MGRSPLMCDWQVIRNGKRRKCSQTAKLHWVEYFTHTKEACSIEYLCPTCCFYLWLIAKEFSIGYSVQRMQQESVLPSNSK